MNDEVTGALVRVERRIFPGVRERKTVPLERLVAARGAASINRKLLLAQVEVLAEVDDERPGRHGERRLEAVRVVMGGPAIGTAEASTSSWRSEPPPGQSPPSTGSYMSWTMFVIKIL